MVAASRAATGSTSRGGRGRAPSGCRSRTSTAGGQRFWQYQRWSVTGVFEAMLETLPAVIERDTDVDMIDSTVVEGHHCAVGLKEDEQVEGLDWLRAASQPSYTPLQGLKPTAMVRAGPEQAHEVRGFVPLFRCGPIW